MSFPNAPPDAHFDALETRSADEREATLRRALPVQIAHAAARAPGLAAWLRGVDPAAVTSRAALAALPVLRKRDLLARQNAGDAPDAFGGFATVGWGASRSPAQRALRVFASPGPIREPETARADYWRMGRALFAAGFRAGDLVHNSFSYHLTPAGSMMESGAHAVGCTVLPAGTERLCGNAQLPAPHPRESRRNRRRLAVAHQGGAERRSGAAFAGRVARD